MQSPPCRPDRPGRARLPVGRAARRASWPATLAVALTIAFVAPSCGGGPDGTSGADGPTRPTVIVTFSVLGALVRDLVGDAAEVSVLMPDGLDPHDWQPSAKDIEAVTRADLVVANGLHLEATLDDALDEAAAIDVRVIGTGERSSEAAGGDADDDGAGSDDPHLWMDPRSMHAVAVALVEQLAAVGVDIGGRAGSVPAALEALDAEVAARLEVVPAERRKLVSGHESLGYFADRYGFSLVGAIVPSSSSQAESSARELSELAATIRAEAVDVVFAEIGTSPDVVDTVASETGAKVVELATHDLPDDGTYRTFMLDLAGLVASALTS
jgi:zinc/manganese transport system substrate-binding protein